MAPLLGPDSWCAVSYACRMAKQKTQLPYLVKYNFRIRSDLKAALERLARKAPRSLNAEITERLERSLEPKTELKDFTDGELIDELIRRWGRDAVYIQLGKRPEP
jgi:hypothetical protein